MTDKIQYTFTAKMWRHSDPAGWYFISLCENISSEIRGNLKWQEEGCGRMKAIAKINNLEWETAIWFDTKMNTYLLPVKAAIRKNANLKIDKMIEVKIWL